MTDRKARARLLAWYVFFGLAWLLPSLGKGQQRFNYSGDFIIRNGRPRRIREWSNPRRRRKGIVGSRYQPNPGTLGNTIIAVPAGSSLVKYLNSYSAAGVKFQLAANTTYLFDMSMLTVSPTSVVIEGAGTGATDTGGADVLTTGTIINFTALNAANVHPWSHVVFHNLKIIAPTAPATTGSALWNGSSNLDFEFWNVVFADVAPASFLNAGPDQQYFSSRWIQSSTPPAQMVMGNLNPTGRIIARDCVIDYNPQLAGTWGAAGVRVWVGAAGYGTGAPAGPWVITGCQFLPSANGWAADAIVDLESVGTAMGDLTLQDNYFHNCRTWGVQGEKLLVKNNRVLWDALPSYATGNAVISLYICQTANPANLGGWNLATIDGNTIINNLGAANTTVGGTYSVNPSLDVFTFDVAIRTLIIRSNSYYYDSRATGGSPAGVIQVTVNADSTNSPAIGTLIVAENTFGCVNVSGTLLQGVAVAGKTSAGPLDRLIVRGNKGVGAMPATNDGPATVASGYLGVLVLGQAAQTWTINAADCEGNDMGAGQTSAVWLKQAGTLTITRPNFRNNWPRETSGPFLPGTPGITYTHGTSTYNGGANTGTGPAIMFVRCVVNTALVSLTLNGILILNNTTAVIETFTIPLKMGDVVVFGTATNAPVVEIVVANSTD